MSGASTWLHGQRKSELSDLAEKVGLTDYTSLKKADLETALDEHMRANADRLSKDNSLAQFYKRIGASTTPARNKEVALVDKESKTPAPKQRRQTKAKEEIEADGAEGASTSALATRTPKPKIPFPASVPLPPSPAVVAQQIERQGQRVRSRLNEAYASAGIDSTIGEVRERVSTSAFVETTALAIELFGLGRAVLPFKFLTTLPASATLGTGEIPIKVPDVFVLLTAGFWGTIFAWLLTSVALPLTASYFFNPTLKASGKMGKKTTHSSAQYDLLTFNVAKALITFLVYGRGVDFFGYPGDLTKARVQLAVPGGYQGILIASGVGALVSLYEAVLKK